MKQLETTTRVALMLACAQCSALNDFNPPRKFCHKCGHSCERQVAVQLCPFCGEEMDKYHLDDECDVTMIWIDHEDFIAQDPDGDFWMAELQMDYDSRDGFHLRPFPPGEKSLRFVKSRIFALRKQTDALASVYHQLGHQLMKKGESTNGST